MDVQIFRQPGAQGSNRFEDQEGCVLLLERNIKVEFLFSKSEVWKVNMYQSHAIK